MRRYKVMVIESDPIIKKFVRANLEARYYETLTTSDGSEGTIPLLIDEDPNLVLLGVAPDNNLDWCRKIRQASRVPIIVLSERADEAWKVKCFDAGADDFIAKPFGMEELMARVRAVLRRAETVKGTPLPPSFKNGALEIRFAERRVTVSAREVRLTPTEYSLLQELALNPDKVLTHNALLNKVWGPEYSQAREYLRVFIGRLRRKLESGTHKPDYIVTIPWVGYKLTTSPEPERVAAMEDGGLAAVGSR